MPMSDDKEEPIPLTEEEARKLKATLDSGFLKNTAPWSIPYMEADDGNKAKSESGPKARTGKDNIGKWNQRRHVLILTVVVIAVIIAVYLLT